MAIINGIKLYEVIWFMHIIFKSRSGIVCFFSPVYFLFSGLVSFLVSISIFISGYCKLLLT